MAQQDTQAELGTHSLNSVGRLNTREHLVSNPCGVGASTVGVEVLPLGLAPNGEIVRVNVNADHAHAFCLKTFAADFGSGQPLIVGPMEFVTILEHHAEPVKALPLEPHHASGLNAFIHHQSPEVADKFTVTEGIDAENATTAATEAGFTLFTHLAKAPEGSDYSDFLRFNDPLSRIRVRRFKSQDFASVNADVHSIDGKSSTNISIGLDANQCEALGRALLDAAHDLRTHNSADLLISSMAAMLDGSEVEA